MRSASSGADKSSMLCPISWARRGLGFAPKTDSSSSAAMRFLRSPSSGDDEPAPEHPGARVDGIVENAGLTGRDAVFGLDELDLARRHEQCGSRRTSRANPRGNRQSAARQSGDRARTDPIDIAQPKPRHRKRGARADDDARISCIEPDYVEGLGRRDANAASLANGKVNHAAVPSENATVRMDDLAGNGSAWNQALDHLGVMPRGYKADVLAVGLLGIHQAKFARQFAHPR